MTVSLAGADVTEAGTTLVVFFAGGNGQFFGTTDPPGWAKIASGGGATGGTLGIFLRGPTQGLAAGESSWNFTPFNATAGPVKWWVGELEGIASGDLLGTAVVDANSGVSVTVATSGTTMTATAGASSTYDGLALSAHVSYNTSGTDSWGSHTGGFAEIFEGSQAGSGSDVTDISVSGLPVQQIGTYGPTATCSRTLTGDPGAGYSYSFVLTAEGARKAANLKMIDGAEHGLITGNTLGPTNNRIMSSATAGVSVSAAAKRSGNYGYRLTSTNAACNFTPMDSLAQRTGQKVDKRYFIFRTALPSNDVEIWRIGNRIFRFRVASGKIGYTVGTGTEVLSDQAITVDQWFGIELVIDSPFLWNVDYNAELTNTTPAVEQTPPTGSGGDSSVNYRIGWTETNGGTITMDTDDAVMAIERAAYPIGDVRVLPLKVDPAGTPTISGTSTNFGVMVNDGTVNAWDATNARNAIDDVPPDLSATRDAAVMKTAHATDYAEFPMETYDMAAGGVNVRGVGWKACLWAASATAATIRIRISDGAEIVGAGLSEQDPGADNSATPVWVCGPARPTTGRVDWTQAKVDALAFRMGSNDATPDIGVDSVVFELAVVKTVTEDLFGEAGAPVHITAKRDPDTNGLVGMTITTVGAGVTVDYEVDSVAQTPVVVVADATQYVPILGGGEDFPSVNRITVTPG